MSQIKVVIKPNLKKLSPNFNVRRSLPSSQNQMVGPFIFWDHFGPTEITPQNTMVVRAHPHIGLATITWLFKGEIMHRDSLSNEQMIRPGEVNWMTAGEGIVHSERSEPLNKSYELEGIQLWLALPKVNESVRANFFHCKESDVPFIKKNGIELRLIAGEAFGKKSPVPVYSDLFYLNGRGKNGESLNFPINDDQETAIYIIKGDVSIEGQTFQRFDLIVIEKGIDLKLSLLSDSHFMIFGGRPFNEKRHMWWNFVSTSLESIEKAKKKWKEGGFPDVINESEKISLLD